jgi:hypothetical protein
VDDDARAERLRDAGVLVSPIAITGTVRRTDRALAPGSFHARS